MNCACVLSNVGGKLKYNTVGCKISPNSCIAVKPDIDVFMAVFTEYNLYKIKVPQN